MQENYINKNKIKENKYKILRMSLILGADDNRDETITNFEESAREIDAMNDETYLRDLEDKFYDTLKLEEEEKKLAVLVDYIGGRVEQRISLLSDFANVTGYDLSNLPPIKYYDKLDDYKERLKYIREYLSNTEQINKLTTEIEEAEEKLKEAYENKATSEDHNAKMEDALLNKFYNIVKGLEIFKDTNEENIDIKLNEVINNVEESKKSLDIFLKSYNTLRGSGISYEEEYEYKSYVDNAKEVYYSNKENEYLLTLYKLLLTKETEYSEIIVKRNSINQILCERLELRKELDIEDNDILSPLYDLLERQYQDIEHQKENIDTIEYLNKLIELKKEEKNNLDQENQKVEILSLLREFCIIDTYSDIEESKIDELEESAINELEESAVNETTKTDDDKPEEAEVESTTTTIAEMEDPIDKLLNSEIPNEEETTDNEEKIIIPSDILMPKEMVLEINEEEKIEDNQVIEVEDAKNIDIDLIQSKAEKVMQRVGEMLGIKTEETKIVSVTNEPVTEVQPEKEEPVETPAEKTTEEIIQNPFMPTEEPAAFVNPLPAENPLFNNTMPELEEKPADPEDSNDFWFPSDMPDALNELPDLEVANNNFFGENSLPDLNFPDLKIDFGTNNTEEK